MKDLLTYYSDNPTILELLEQGVYFSEHLLKEFNTTKDQLYPAIVQSENKRVHMFRWGIENQIMASGPRLTSVYAPNIPKQNKLISLFRKNRIVVPVNRYTHQTVNGSEVILRNKESQLMYLAGVWYSGEDQQACFSLITVDSPDPSKIRRVPLFIRPAHINLWLDRNTKIEQLQSIILDEIPTYGIEISVPQKVEA